MLIGMITGETVLRNLFTSINSPKEGSQLIFKIECSNAYFTPKNDGF
jgi:hypothetical protein